MVSQQHGTIRTDAEAPSYFGVNSEAYFSGALLASVGFITACPDYIGYGESKNVAHPYEHRKSLAQASLDMIRASKEFINKNTDIKWDNRLYITGFSQGGFATMALQKMIEEETGTEFNLRASSCGAGAYNKTATMKNLVTQSTSTVVSNNALYAWVLQTYNTVYKIGRPMSFYFKEPYATQVQTSALGATISVAFSKSLTDTFVKSINDGTDAAFAAAVADNDIFDWKPITPTRLYHGDADELVPFLNSQTAFDAMRKRGATNVELYKLAGATHGTAVQNYLIGTYEMFTTVK
jgi:pimeloyl-ACP methyl ester carboxylesterase